MATHEKPIGYWLKHCHDLLDRYISTQQAENEIDRLDWQILNVLHQQAKPDSRLEVELEPFASSCTISSHLGQLRDKGLLSPGNEITEKGRESFQAFAAVQDKIREVVSSGISQEQYETTINVLRRIADNIEQAGV
ncbi:MAG: hypothetical protein L0H94_07305 [Nitrospira sp.]|nr:hypothetical protein [Nitrospira sp.]